MRVCVAQCYASLNFSVNTNALRFSDEQPSDQEKQVFSFPHLPKGTWGDPSTYAIDRRGGGSGTNDGEQIRTSLLTPTAERATDLFGFGFGTRCAKLVRFHYLCLIRSYLSSYCQKVCYSRSLLKNADSH